MKKSVLGLVLLLLLALVIVIAATRSRADQVPPARTVVHLAAAATVDAPSTPPAPAATTKEYDELQAYVLASMKKWASIKDDLHYVGIAHDITTVVLDPIEKPLWKDDTRKTRTAIAVASVAFWESRFWQHVDDGRCNNPQWRKSSAGMRLMGVTGDCDGGWAYTMFQIHPEGGITLTDDGEWRHAFDPPVRPGFQGDDMIRDRRVGIRVALHMIRKSLRMSGTLCGYTGEIGPCPKGKARLDFAANWSRNHPM